MKVIPSCLLSLPAWGARIEISYPKCQMENKWVAPRMGSEDRNMKSQPNDTVQYGRSPHGERG